LFLKTVTSPRRAPRQPGQAGRAADFPIGDPSFQRAIAKPEQGRGRGRTIKNDEPHTAAMET